MADLKFSFDVRDIDSFLKSIALGNGWTEQIVVQKQNEAVVNGLDKANSTALSIRNSGGENVFVDKVGDDVYRITWTTNTLERNPTSYEEVAISSIKNNFLAFIKNSLVSSEVIAARKEAEERALSAFSGINDSMRTEVT